MLVLTPLAEYAKQRGLSRARAYQLKPTLKVVDLPVNVTVCYERQTFVIRHHTGTPVQTFVVQSRSALEKELLSLQEQSRHCHTIEARRLNNMIETLKQILQ